MNRFAAKYASVALSVLGSAILLFSCTDSSNADGKAAEELMMTEYSENLSIVSSQNGRRSYHFETPLLEGYGQAREPFREFRKGIRMTTYKDDSLSTVDAVLTANYAIYYEKRELWEAKGDVVVAKSDGRTLYTQQLFWNARTKKIYSNVDSKIVQNEGRDVFFGEGFESDEDFKDWRFRRNKIRMEVDATPRDPADSAARAEAAERPRREEPAAGGSRMQRPAPSKRTETAPSKQTEPVSSKRIEPASQAEAVQRELPRVSNARMEMQSRRLEAVEADAAVRADKIE